MRDTEMRGNRNNMEIIVLVFKDAELVPDVN